MRDLTLAVDNTVSERFDVLQARECLAVHVLARELVGRILGHSWEDTDRRQQAKAQYLATYALRSMQDRWVRAADRAAKDALVRTLKTACGSKFTGLPEAQYEVYASLLLHAMKSAYSGVLEGSSPMAPGTYLAIIGDEP